MKRLSFVILFLIILVYPNFIYAFEVNAQPQQVNSAETFNFEITMNENIYLANGHIKYDPKLFTYISSNTDGISVEKLKDGEIAWIYTDLSNSPKGIQNIEFTFIAVSVGKDTAGNFEISDSIYIDTNENIYENNNFIYPVKILAKYVMPIPATGGFGIGIFIVVGLSLIGFAVLKLKKEDK